MHIQIAILFEQVSFYVLKLYPLNIIYILLILIPFKLSDADDLILKDADFFSGMIEY